MAGPLISQKTGATGATSGGWFLRFANTAAKLTGKPATFILAALIVIVWALSGPFFHYSDTWQLVINTGTTVVTFLMVFLIQNTQNREALALQLKLDELIRTTENARNKLVSVEEASEGKLEELKEETRTLADN
jgi:low affinity Fe/Cu permease